MPRWLWLVYAIIFGLCIGSFINVLIWRLPRRARILGRSRCPCCLGVIRWYDNIPLLSFLMLRARCRACARPISWRYPLVEFGTAALWAFTIWWFGPTARGVTAALFLSSLLVVSLIDAEHMIIPDAVSVPLIGAGLLAAWTGWGPSFRSAVVSAVSGALLIAIVAIVTRGGVGTGDVMLAAALGANLGVTGIVLALWLCFVLGGAAAVVCLAFGLRGRKEPIPYGPCLAVGGAIALFATPAFSDWFVRTFRIGLAL